PPSRVDEERQAGEEDLHGQAGDQGPGEGQIAAPRPVDARARRPPRAHARGPRPERRHAPPPALSPARHRSHDPRPPLLTPYVQSLLPRRGQAPARAPLHRATAPRGPATTRPRI